MRKKLPQKEHVHLEKSLRRVKQVHSDLSHQLCFKMKVRRSIYMISHLLIQIKIGQTCLKTSKFVIIKCQLIKLKSNNNKI